MIERRNTKEGIMSTARFIYWQDDEMWLGYLEKYPDYLTQGKSSGGAERKHQRYL
jgi:hypothetical protein